MYKEASVSKSKNVCVSVFIIGLLKMLQENSGSKQAHVNYFDSCSFLMKNKDILGGGDEGLRCSVLHQVYRTSNSCDGSLKSQMITVYRCYVWSQLFFILLIPAWIPVFVLNLMPQT